MENTEWFARFNSQLYNKEKNIRLLKDDDSIHTRYYIADEDIDSYYICREANSLSEKGTIKLAKAKEGSLYDVYIENTQ